MKTLPLLFLAAVLLTSAGAASAQITKMSNRKLHAETRRAERQAHRVARKEAPEYRDSYLDMSDYNMKVGAEGRKARKTNDGRDNYQFNKNGEALVTESVLTRKRLKRSK